MYALSADDYNNWAVVINNMVSAMIMQAKYNNGVDMIDMLVKR